jgi:hypothetical protein
LVSSSPPLGSGESDGREMTAAHDEKNKTAAVLYRQIAKEAEVVAADQEKSNLDWRIERLKDLSRCYALVAEAPLQPDS